MDEKVVLPLNEATNLAEVGGKALALGKLINAGFTIPNGFVLTTVVQEMNPTLEEEILAAFDALRVKHVAVRSSAAAEDGRDATWAGQFDTYLNVPREDLIEKIKLCWSSRDSQRVRAYALHHHLEVGRVAVIIQEMVQSEVSGIAFSVNPITQDGQEVVIEAGLGLGETFVSGQLTPDTYIASKDSTGILDKRISTQSKKMILNEEGSNTWQVVGIEGQHQKLSDEQIQKLTGIIAKLESTFNYPVDAEWGFADRMFYILQARPITTLTR
jgi:phosphoenolpyruvate synthase/pyruvate phosphate dikinase